MPDQQDFDMNEVLARDKAAHTQSFDMQEVLARDARTKLVATNPASYLMQLKQSAQGGFLETPGFQPSPGWGNQAAYLAGKYGPTAVGATIGSPGGTIGTGVGAAMGRSLQNLAQRGANQASPGSAAQKSDLGLIVEPSTDALAQALTAGLMKMGVNAVMKPAAQYISGMTGVKQNLVQRTMGNISRIFSSPPVEEAGNAIGALADKTGIKTGGEGYRLATTSILGKESATDLFSANTTLRMYQLAKDAGIDAMTPQEQYSLAEGLKNAIRWDGPTHGQVAQNMRQLTGMLSQLEDRLEISIPGYSNARANYANALAKEAFSSASPMNKTGGVAQLKLMAATPQALLGLGGAFGMAKGYHDGNPVEMLLSAALLSPLMVGKGLQAGTMAASTKIPQILGRTGIAAGTEALRNAGPQ